MTGYLLRAAVAFAVWVGFAPSWLAAQPAGEPTPARPAARASEVSNTGAAIVGADPHWHKVRLGSDGSIIGRTAVYDAAGERHAVRMRIVLAQNGRLVASTRSNELGQFQLPNVRPGVYSALAASRAGVAAMAVRVLPHSEKGAKDQVQSGGDNRLRLAALAANEDAPADDSEPILDIVVVPPEDSNLLSNLLAEEVPVGPQATVPVVPLESGGAMGGGAGGGGGGLGGLLGAAGLGFGIAGLGDNGTGQGGVASPFKPQ